MKHAFWSIATFLLAYGTAVGTTAVVAPAIPAELAVLMAYLAMFGVTCLSALRHGLPIRWSSRLARGFVYGGIFIATSLSYRFRLDTGEQWASLTVLVTFPVLIATMLIAWAVGRRPQRLL